MADADADIGASEEIELKELEAAEDDDETERIEETNLDDLDDIDDDGNTDLDDGPCGSYLDSGDIPDNFRGLKRLITEEIKKFLKNALAVSLNKGDGPNSKTIFDNIQLTNDLRSKKNNGAKYNGVKIIVTKDGRYEYSSSSDKKTTQAIAEFKATLEKAKAEHEKTAIGDVEKQLEDFGSLGVEDVSQEEVVSILSDVEERLSNRLNELQDDALEVRRGGLTKAEVDELIGILSFDRTEPCRPKTKSKP